MVGAIAMGGGVAHEPAIGPVGRSDRAESQNLAGQRIQRVRPEAQILQPEASDLLVLGRLTEDAIDGTEGERSAAVQHQHGEEGEKTGHHGRAPAMHEG